MTDPSPLPAVLEYVEVHALRHVRPGTRVAFGRGINVVLGHNGTGKTTLLELVAALERSNFHVFAHETFSISFAMRSGDARLEGKLINVLDERTREFRFVGEYREGAKVVSIDSNGDRARLEVVLGGSPLRGSLSFAPIFSKDPDSYFGNAIRTVASFTSAALSEQAFDDAMTLYATSSIAHRHYTRMNEGIEAFQDLFNPDNHASKLPLGIAYIVPAEAVGENPVVLGHHIPEPESIPADYTKSTIEIPPQNLAFLNRFVKLSQYADASLVLTRTGHETRDFLTRTTFGNPFIRFKLRNGNEIPHQQLSYGEKRLLTFLIKLFFHPAAIVVDELANGLHYAWIEACIEMLEAHGTQAFLSSQNPLLLDALPLSRETFGSVHGIVICEFDEEGGQMVWRNPSAREAEDFFASYDVGIQYISEIMRNMGLW